MNTGTALLLSRGKALSSVSCLRLEARSDDWTENSPVTGKRKNSGDERYNRH